MTETLTRGTERRKKLFLGADLGHVGLLETVKLSTNDPRSLLVNKIRSGRTWEDLNIQAANEFFTDMSERADGNFCNSFDFIASGNDLIEVDTGQSMQVTLDQGEATTRSEVDYMGTDILAQVDQARKNEPAKINEWLRNDGSNFLVVSSLCPKPETLTAVAASRAYYRLETRTSSLCVYERLEGGVVRMHAVSLDNHTMEVHQKACGRQFQNNVEAVASPQAVHAENLQEVLDIFIEAGATHTPQRSSQDRQKRLEHAFQYWLDAHTKIEASLKSGSVSEVFDICVKLGLKLKPKPRFDLEDAGLILRHLRNVVLPFYVQHGQGLSYDQDSVAAASGAAVESGYQSSGVCPDIVISSSTEPSTETYFSRYLQASKLRSKKEGAGSCSSCGAISTMYGCGVFCKGCNDAWCDEYQKSGRMLKPSEIRRGSLIWLASF